MGTHGIDSMYSDAGNAPDAGFSRRSFLKGTALAGFGAVAAGIFGAPEVAHAEKAVPDTQVESGPEARHAYDTYTTDVVVIGSGLAGLMAARSAYAKGASVLVVDKGPFGHSGASGINWGHMIMSYETTSSEYLATVLGGSMMEGMTDQEYYKAIVEASKEARVLAQAVETGTVLELTSVDEGNAHNRDMGFLRMAEPVMPRFMAQSVRRSGIKTIDRTMVLDVLVDEEGAAAGVVGLDLIEGRGVVVRAKSVVMCTGSPCWANGWSGVGAKTNASPENTGDGLAILLNRGVPVKNLEQWDMYFYNVHPNGIAFSQGVGVSVGDHPENIMNKDGERFLNDNELFQAGGATGRGLYEMFTMREVYEGRGSENGGLWYDTTRLEEPGYVMAFNRRVPENQARALGYQVPDVCELVPTPWESAGAPHLDVRGQTAIPGLFFANAGDQAYGGSCATVCSAGGHLAGGSAAELAASRDLSALDVDAVQSVLAKAYAALENAPADGVRANEVMHVIQNIMNQYCWMGRTDEGLRTAISELFRVRDELFPRMVVTDKSTHFNQEWRQALEVPFMWTVVMATAWSALTRTESRGSHHRLDYPKTDNANWLKNVYVSVDEDGSWSTECKDIVDTVMASQLVAAMVPEGSIAD